MNPIQIIVPVITFIVGLIGGCFVAVYFLKNQAQKMKKQLETLDKDQLRNMASAFGRKPSEEQLNKMMQSVENLKKKSKLKKPKKNS